MKKSARKLFSMVLALALSFPFSTLTYANSNVVKSTDSGQASLTSIPKESGLISVQYTHTDTIKYNFVIKSGGSSYIDASMYLESNANSCKIQAILQRRKSGGSWSDVKKFTATGSSRAIMSNDWYLNSGYEYRVNFHFYAYQDGRLAEQITKKSSVQTY